MNIDELYTKENIEKTVDFLQDKEFALEKKF